MAMGEEAGAGTSSPQGLAGRGRVADYLGAGRKSQLRRAHPCHLLGLGPWKWMVLSRCRRNVATVGEAMDEETDSSLAHASQS